MCWMDHQLLCSTCTMSIGFPELVNWLALSCTPCSLTQSSKLRDSAECVVEVRLDQLPPLHRSTPVRRWVVRVAPVPSSR